MSTLLFNLFINDLVETINMTNKGIDVGGTDIGGTDIGGTDVGGIDIGGETFTAMLDADDLFYEDLQIILNSNNGPHGDK